MMKLITKLLGQPYWVLALILGVALVAFPCVDIDKDHWMTSHAPNTLIPVTLGFILVLLSSAAFGFTLFQNHLMNTGAGIDLTRVKEENGMLWTKVGDSEIRVINGHIEKYARTLGAVVALPCNEYFDDECAFDQRSSLGAYVSHVFEGQAAEFISLAKEECKVKFGSGIEQQKTDKIRAVSFGTGKCVLLQKPLGRSVSVALVSTTTHRADEGLAGRISYLFDGMRELATCLARVRVNEVVMPVLGAGHAGIYAPLALVGLLLAAAEVTRYGQGGQRLKKITVVVFKRDADSPPQVDPVVVRRALALIGS